QPPVPTPHQPTVYSHPEGRSAMIPPPMVAPSLQAPDEQLMPIHHRNPTLEESRQRLHQWMYGNPLHVRARSPRPQEPVFPAEQLMPIHRWHTPVEESRPPLRQVMHTNTSQDTTEQYTFLDKYKQ
ncbi:hypothetical protein L9F63_027593, partial [Diploptera punctata]